MGRNEELHVNVPSFFRCPISLDVMKSPVSLCTGVTYDRSSIQRWLEAGNNTCPATMQVLPTTDLVPNHTLHRLIQTWSPPTTTATTTSVFQHDRPEPLIRELRSSTDPLPLLHQLSCIPKESEAFDELMKVDGLISVLNGVLLANVGKDVEIIDLAVGIMVLVLNNNIDTIKCLANPSTIGCLLTLLRNGKSPNSRSNSVRIMERISSIDTESKLLVAGTEGILSELARFMTEESNTLAIDAVLSCLISLASPRRVRYQIVRLGIVPTLGKLLSQSSFSGSMAEKALKLLETASTCTEGRSAICEDADVVVTAIVGKMMKVSSIATEHAVVVLWSVCHLFRDRRAEEAVARSNGLTKILLLMQSSCSPAGRQMAGDLLKIFRVYSKSCLGSYDTKTTHIMPF